MTDIFSYEVINPVINNKTPWYNPKTNILYIPNSINKYKYYVECAINVDKLGRQYYILLSANKFNENCRKCNIDGYGRLKIQLRGEIKEYFNEYSKNNNININLDFQDSNSIYDVYCINI